MASTGEATIIAEGKKSTAITAEGPNKTEKNGQSGLDALQRI